MNNNKTYTMLRTCNLILYACIAFKYSMAKSPLRIFGGSDANPDKYPYVVRLELQISKKSDNSTIINTMNFHRCTSSAITDTWVLTAAHCLDGLEGVNANPVVRYGHVLHPPWTKDSFSDVLVMIIHPLYTPSHRKLKKRYMKNDIGLMKTTPMKIRTFMKLSAVDYLTFYGHEAIITGFGITTKTLADGTIVTNTTLNLQLPLQVLDVLVTKCSYKPYNFLVPGLCLTTKCGVKLTACKGDSGGPLIHPSGQIGIISTGEPSSVCLLPTKRKRPSIAGIVIAISPYIEWINSYVSL